MNIVKMNISTLCIYILSVFSLAWALPSFYNMLFDKEVAKTAIFYSPTDKKIYYTEQLRIDDPKAAEKSEDHHADVVYKDENGNYFDRVEFEAKIPFIYYRNMEMRGLMPLQIDGQSYDRARIEKHRRVLELNSRQLDHKMHEYKIYPLLESSPNQVALILPADRFRMTQHAMQFIDSDENATHKELTEKFTRALKQNGFVFPAQNVWGNFTIFKPYDAGVFILDAENKTYHIVRKNDEPIVTRVPFQENIIPKKIIISEVADRQLFGLMLDKEDKIYLFHTKNYALTHIPAPHYNSENMDFKVLLDPIYLTTLYSDDEHAYAVAYPFTITDNAIPPKSLNPQSSFDMKMSRTQSPFYAYIAKIIFPFRIEFQAEDSAKGVFRIHLNGFFTIISILFSVLLAYFYRRFCLQKGYQFTYEQGAAIVCLGIYALIPLLLMEEYRVR